MKLSCKVFRKYSKNKIRGFFKLELIVLLEKNDDTALSCTHKHASTDQ